VREDTFRVYLYSSPLDNGQTFPSLGSRDKPAQNGDGSTDPLHRPQSTRWQGWQLARDRAGQEVFCNTQALRPDRSSVRQELEAWRHREGEVT
jgi:hypothetical protein